MNFAMELREMTDKAKVMPYAVREKIDQAMGYFKEKCQINAMYGMDSHSDTLVIEGDVFTIDNKDDAEKVRKFILDLAKNEGFLTPNATIENEDIVFSIKLTVKW